MPTWRNKNSHIYNLALQAKDLEKGEYSDPQIRRRMEIIKLRAEINEIENKKD